MTSFCTGIHPLMEYLGIKLEVRVGEDLYGRFFYTDSGIGTAK